MKQTLLLLLGLTALLSSCTAITHGQLQVVSLGGDISNFRSNEVSFDHMNNSTGLAHTTTMVKDITKIVTTGQVTKAISKDLLGGLKTTEGTRRVIDNNKTSVKINDSNNKLARDTFVPPVEEAPPAVTPP